MIRSYRSMGGGALVFLWIFFRLCVVLEGRRYDKCLTRDGRQGVCVVKRYCREANHHACHGDAENYCCPISTTQRNVSHTRPSARPTKISRFDRPTGTSIDYPIYSTKRELETTARPKPPRRQSPKVPEIPLYSTKREFETTARPKPPRRQSPKVPEIQIYSTKREPETTARPKPPRRQSPKVPACGVKPYELFIAGGEKSDEHEWPWMTAIFRRHPDSRPKTFLCGGSLINTKYVLTAAHCFVNNYITLPASSFVVRVGAHFLNSGEEYTVSNLALHPNHSGSDFSNDIALVQLASEVYITDKTVPICLPDPGMMYDNFVGRMATVAGWGDTSFRTGHTRILQHVIVPIVSGEECFAAYSRVRGAAFLARGSDHVICAGLKEGGKDACRGDSGGPLMLKMLDDRWMVVGIVSRGYMCAEPGYPGVYTRVTHYLSWINTNMKRH